MRQLGQAIVKKRKELGLTQTALAKKAGISVNALCSIEKGKSIPWPDTYDKIFHALGVKPIFILIDMNLSLEKAVDAFLMFNAAMNEYLKITKP